MGTRGKNIQPVLIDMSSVLTIHQYGHNEEDEVGGARGTHTRDKKVYKILVGNLGKPISRYMDNFKVDLGRYAVVLCRMFRCGSGQVPLEGFCEYGRV